MSDIDVDGLMANRYVGERVEIARRVGERLCMGSLSPADRVAVESLARNLVEDAILRVRAALAASVAETRFLPKDIARLIAHDVDEISCPFLSVTDVFSDEEWCELVSTVSHAARCTIAARPCISQEIAMAIANHCDGDAAAVLAGNTSAPMTPPVGRPLIETHGTRADVVEALCGREDLHPDIVAMLVGKVSAAAHDKLIRKFGMPDHVTHLVAESEIDSMVKLVKQTSPSRIGNVTRRLHEDQKLDPILLLAALREGAMDFFVAAMTVLTGGDPLKTKRAVHLEGPDELGELLENARIPTSVHPQFWKALEQARAR